MADLSKFYERAEKALQKGKPEQALEAYEDALEINGRDERALEAAADLSNTLGDVERAKELLQQLFDTCLEGGSTARLVTIYKKLARLSVVDEERLRRYAQAVEGQNRREATDIYEMLVTRRQAAGDGKAVLEILGRLMAMEPSTELYQRHADQAASLGEKRLAADSYIQLALSLERTHGDAVSAYAKAHEQDPRNLAACFGYGKALLAQGQYEKSIELLSPLASYPSAPMEAREPYVQALLHTGRVLETESSLWELYQLHPEQYGGALLQLVGALVGDGRSNKAVVLARKIETKERLAGHRRQFLLEMQKVASTAGSDTTFLQYMAELYDAANMEKEYGETLSRLFDLYLEQDKPARALRALEDSVELNLLDPMHRQRLQMLIGKVDHAHLGLVASRLGVDLGGEKAPQPLMAVPAIELPAMAEPVVDLQAPATDQHQEPEKAAAVEKLPEELENLLLDAELSLQYGLTQKANELARQIRYNHPRFAGHPRVRELRMTLGLPVGESSPEASSAPRGTAAANLGLTLETVAEVNRVIGRQSTPELVLKTAAEEVSRRWQAQRCVLALSPPSRPPSLFKECCSPGAAPLPVAPLVKLLGYLQTLCLQAGGDVLVDPAGTEFCRKDAELAVANLGFLLGVPLMDGDHSVGVLLLEAGKGQRWQREELSLLQAVLAQVVLAVNNARLRTLVRQLAVSEEGTGLMKRTSYLDLLLSEAGRVIAQHLPMSLVLLQIGKPSLAKQLGEEGMQGLMQQAGQLICSHIRQNDVAVHYAEGQIALLLASTESANAMLAVEKLRRVLMGLRPAGYDKNVRVWAGVAEVSEMPGFDAADMVTEAINRLEQALWLARTASEEGVFNLPRLTVPQAAAGA
jgi:tetratricopeptide (TPR) repeat protein